MMQTCDYDLFKLDALLKMNIIDWLTYLQFIKQKGEIELFISQTNAR